MIALPPELPAECDSCGQRTPFERIAERCYQVLLDAHYHAEFAQELRMLERVAAFYQRNPGAEGMIQPHVIQVLHSDDPTVRKKLSDGVPMAEIPLPPAAEAPIITPHPDDAVVTDYLRHNRFRLEGRTRFVREAFERTKRSVGQVRCPRCKVGTMRLTAPYRRGGRQLRTPHNQPLSWTGLRRLDT